MTEENSLIAERKKKLEAWATAGFGYADKFDRTHTSVQAKEFSEKKAPRELEKILEKPDSKVRICGRLMNIREMGKLAFLRVRDGDGDFQICFSKPLLGDDFKKFIKLLDLGDFCGFSGEIFITKHGEPTLLATEIFPLAKALRPLPEKFHGLNDRELCYRQRYLDTLTNPESKQRFVIRSQVVRKIREYLHGEGFIEMEYPILDFTASGALASTFHTHHEALDADMYLRIALETHQKMAIAGGFEKVFEIGKLFRNEGIDPSHLQEFTGFEWYEAYVNYERTMERTRELLLFILDEVFKTRKLEIPDRNGKLQMVDFGQPWPSITFRDLLVQDCGIDIDKFDTVEKLRDEIKKKKIKLEKTENLGYGNLVDNLYKKVSRPKLVEPIFVTQHPMDVSPLARANDENPKVVDRFQLVLAGWEMCNAYSELIDPVEQEKRFAEQAAAKAGGDEEAHGHDDQYILAMEHGMPPISGIGIGIDRLVTLLTKQTNLKDCVLFPIMKPEKI